jgi:hypothetical protein
MGVRVAAGLVIIVVGLVMQGWPLLKWGGLLQKRREEDEHYRERVESLPTDFLKALLKVSPWPVAVGVVDVLVGAWLLTP